MIKSIKKQSFLFYSVVDCPVCNGNDCHTVKCLMCKVNTENCHTTSTCYIEVNQNIDLANIIWNMKWRLSFKFKI